MKLSWRLIHCNTFKFQDEPNVQTGQKSALQHSLFWRYAYVSKLMPTIHTSMISTFQWGDFRELKAKNVSGEACPLGARLGNRSVRPSSAPASNDLFLLNTLCVAVFVLSALVTGLKNSVIVGNNSEYLSNLTNWIKPRRSENDWELCWRKSRHGWDNNTFHSLCDEKGPTITIVKVGHRIFGGYASLSWRMSAGKYSRLCCLKELPPNLNNFLLYLKHIYQIENNASTVKNKWEPLLPYISLLTWVSKT